MPCGGCSWMDGGGVSQCYPSPVVQTVAVRVQVGMLHELLHVRHPVRGTESLAVRNERRYGVGKPETVFFLRQ